MKFKRFLSIILSLLLISGFFNFPIQRVNASGIGYLNPRKDIKNFIANYEDVNVQRAISQKFGQVEFDDNAVSEKINADDEVRVIVELDKPSAVELTKGAKLSSQELKSIEKKVEDSQKSVLSKVQNFGKLRHTYKNVLNGFSMTIKYGDLDELKGLKDVKKVTVANIYYPDINNARELTKANSVLQSFGFKGEGTVVAIVDTGIDYTHKDMKLTDSSKAKITKEMVEQIGGPGKFYTDKVPYGYNFADLNDEVIDRTSSMHGMHVGGIVAANGDVKGVAPEAQLLAMKVFSNNPELSGAYTDDIAAAIDDAVRHGADVINMSLGSTAGYVMPDDPEQRAIKNATDAGVVVVVSGGNSYYSTYGYYYPYAQDPDMGLVGSPGLFPDTLQVASSENTTITLPALDYNYGENSGLIGYTTSEVDPYGVLRGEYELVDCGLGRVQDFEGKNLQGKIALIERGAITFVEKKLNAQNAGAIGVIVFNSTAGGDTYINMATDSRIYIPGIFVKRSDGLTLRNNIANGIKVLFKGKVASAPNANAGRMSDFSSWGPSPDLSFKPDVTAPGGQIYSTVNDNSYETMSGTSMAAPHASGAVALVVQYLKKNYSTLTGRELVERAKILLTNSAIQIVDPSTGTAKLPCLPRKQGAGLIQIDKALNTKAYVVGEDGKAVVALKSFDENSRQFNLIIHNFGDKNITFRVSDKYGVLTNIVYNGFIYPYAALLSGATVSFNNQDILVKAGESAEVSVTLNIPTDAPKNIFVEGFLTLEDTDIENPNPSLVVPYIGFYGKWDEPRIIDAPMWDENTYYGETSLIDGHGYYLGYVDSQQGMPILNPEYISISPNGDGSFDDVRPVLSFLRNAKEFKVQVLDENKNVLREVATDINIRKNYASSSTYKAYSNWLWDGYLYDGNGGYILAKEGQYYIRVTGKIDYPNANWNVLDIPVKVDLTNPSLNVKVKKVEGNNFEFDFTGTKDNVGVYGYLVYRNEFDTNPVFVKAVDTKTTVMLDGVKNNLIVVAFDFAGNVDGRLIPIDNDVIRITQYPEELTTNNKPEIKFEVNEMISNIVDHFEVEVVDNTTGSAIVAKKSIDKATEYGITSEENYKDGLPDGNYTMNIYVYDGTGKLIGQNSATTIIDTTNPEITVIGENEGIINVDNGSEKYYLNFSVLDNLTGYKLYLNNNLIDERYGDYKKIVQSSYNIPINIAEGDNIVTLKVVDALAHEIVKTVNIKKNTEKPQIIINPINNGYAVTGRIAMVTGRVIYKDKVDVFVNSTKAAVDEQGNFAAQVTFLNYGVNSVEVVAKANTITNTTQVSVVSSPLDFERDILTNTNEVNVPVKILDKDLIQKVDTYLDGKLLTTYVMDNLAEDNLNLQVKDLFKGYSSVEFRITNINGAEYSDYLNIFVDKDFPSIIVYDNFGNSLKDVPLYNVNNITINGTLNEDVKYLKINGQDVQFANGTFERQISLNEGLNRITFEMEDMAGNKNAYVYKVYCDTQSPIIEMVSPLKNKVATDNETYEVKFNAFDNVNGYRVFINGDQMETIEDEVGSGIGKEHSYTVTIPDGQSTVDIMLVDQAGNIARKAIEFYKNVQKPVVLDNGYFDKLNSQDVEADIAMPKAEDYGFKEVKYREKALVKDTDYVVEGKKLTLKKEFLSTLSRGVNPFTLVFTDDTTLEYTVLVDDARSSNIALKSIKVNGKELELLSNVFEYDYEVNPFKSYEVTAEALDGRASVEVTQASNIPGEAVIKVTAEDGSSALYKVRFVIPISITADENVEFKAGDDANINVSAVNTTNTDKIATLIVGLFDKDGKLVQLVKGDYTIKPNDSVNMGATLSTKKEYAGYTIRVLVWDNIDNMNPLAKTMEYTIK